MRLDWASQYGCACVIVEKDDECEAVILQAFANSATYHDGEEDCLCVELPGRPQELYTLEAYRRSHASQV